LPHARSPRRAFDSERVVRGDRGVSDERQFACGREKTHSQVMIGAVRFQYERRVAFVQLIRKHAHLGRRQRIGFKDDYGGIAAEAAARKRVDSKYRQAAWVHARQLSKRRGCIRQLKP